MHVALRGRVKMHPLQPSMTVYKVHWTLVRNITESLGITNSAKTNKKQTSIIIFSYSLCNSGNICNEDWHESKTAYIQTKKFKILNLRHLSQLPVKNPCSSGSSAITRTWACLCVGREGKSRTKNVPYFIMSIFSRERERGGEGGG